MPLSRVDQILMTLGQNKGTAAMPELLCNACASDLPVTGVGMTLMTDGGHGGTIAATDGPARVMKELQLSLGEGPGMDASREGRPVLMPDLARTAPTKWPGFGPAALDAGIAAIFAFPLHVGGIRLGVLELYRSTTGNLDEEALTNALAYADAAVVILLQLQSKTEPSGALHRHLSGPISTVPEVHQATGMITVQAEVELTEAFLLLRARSYADDRAMLDVARDVVARRTQFAPEDDHHE